MVDIKKRLQQNEIKGGAKNSGNAAIQRYKVFAAEQLEEEAKKVSSSRQARKEGQKKFDKILKNLPKSEFRMPKGIL